jgi:hypothetical protein
MVDGSVTHGGMQQAARRIVASVVAGLLLLVTLLALIGTAIRDPKPHDIAVGLVGPAGATAQISSALAQNAPGTFDFTTYTSEADARAAIDRREVDGALVLGAGAPKLIAAGAAGDASVGVMTAAFGNAFKAQGAELQIETVRPFAQGDAHGLILFFVIVAVIIATLIAQVALYTLAGPAGAAARIGVAVVFAVLSGLTAMGVATWIAGDFGGDFWTATGLVMLASAAVGLAVGGFAQLFGRAGIALAVLVVVLLDLVSSGGPGGSQLLPDFYRSLAPWMPAPQLFSALRGALYFNDAGIATPAIVLAAWAAAGLVLIGLGGLVTRRRTVAAPQAAAAH